MSCPDGAAGMPGVILPRKAAAELRKLIEGHASVDLIISAVKLRASAGGSTITTKLIDGTFPDYQRVIPQDSGQHLCIDTADLSGAVERVSAISTEKTRAIKLTIDGAEICVSGTSAEIGSATENIEERAEWSGRYLEIGFNGRYLLDLLSALGADRVRIAITDAASPAVITDHSQTDRNSLCVLMPMRV
jgi:DNA polymerase-3 subunit beta